MQLPSMSPDGKARLQCHLLNEHEKVVEQYDEMFIAISSSFASMNVSVLKVRTQFNNLRLPGVAVADGQSPKLDTIEECFYHLSSYSSWFNTRVLEGLVKINGSKQDKERLQAYCDMRKEFLNESIYMIPNKYSNDQSMYTCFEEQKMVMKIAESANLTGNDLLQLSGLVFKIFGKHVDLLNIQEGCLELVFKIFEYPSDFKLTESDKEILEGYKVLHLSIGEQVYYPSSEELTKVKTIQCKVAMHLFLLV